MLKLNCSFLRPSVLPQWKCHHHRLWRLLLQDVRPARRPGGAGLHGLQPERRRHVSGPVQLGPPYLCWLWWLQLPHLGLTEGGESRWVVFGVSSVYRCRDSIHSLSSFFFTFFSDLFFFSISDDLFSVSSYILLSFLPIFWCSYHLFHPVSCISSFTLPSHIFHLIFFFFFSFLEPKLHLWLQFLYIFSNLVR